jgi:organic hydroperoxide reductase OsmC/OhrA
MAESRRIIYTAEAHVTGGRAEGHGRASDGALEVDLRTPVEMGGAAAAPIPSSCSRSATPRASRAPSAS